MPRPRKPERDRAMRLWLESKKKRQLKDIAKELGVSESQVRKWKCEDKWDKATLLNINGEMTVCVTKSKGAQIGNKNAVGAGAPKGNKNAMITGEFESIFFDTLDEEEQYLISNVTLEKKNMLLSELQLLTVRERRMMQRINKFKKLEGQTSDITTLIEYGATNNMVSTQQVKSKSKLSIIQNLEEALTRIQAQKRQCIDLLDKIERGEMEMW